MPTRILREGIIGSEPVNAISDSAEILYRRLMSVVDDYGRFDAKDELVRARCFPLQLDRWSIERVGGCLNELTVSHGFPPLITVYFCGNKKYLQINNFGQRVQSKAKYPGPEDGEVVQVSPESTVDHGDSPSRASRARSESDTESDTKSDTKSITAPKNGAAKRKTQIPFENPPEEWLAYPVQKMGWERKRAEEAFESMRLWAKSKGIVYLDWMAAWQGWCRRDDEKVPIRSPINGNGTLFPVRRSVAESIEENMLERVRDGRIKLNA